MVKTVCFGLLVCSLTAVILAGCSSWQQGTTPIGTPTPTVQATGTRSGTASAKPTLSPGPSRPINVLWVSDATTGWARTTTNLILHTSDGGKSWQDVTPPYPAGSTIEGLPGFSAFSFLNGTMAWVTIVEKQQPDWAIPSVLFRTSDGGHTWQKTMLPPSELGATHVQFVNAKDGWILASYIPQWFGAAEHVDLFRSTDGGQTWSTVARAGSLPKILPLVGVKSGMGWASATTGWVVGGFGSEDVENTVWLYRTQDGGVSWHPQSLPLPFKQSPLALQTQPPVFFSATEGLLPVIFYNVHKRQFIIKDIGFAVYATHDGGATWSRSTLLSMTGSAWPWDFLTMQQGWVVGANDTTLDETSDGGQHWTPITPSANFRYISQLDFVSAHEG
jgi:photosystem II stability/assembly factor-like uncharacterized protein